MAVFYSIHAYDQESHYHRGENKIDNRTLYPSFRKACDMIEKEIKRYIACFNGPDQVEVFKQPNREEMKRQIDIKKYVHYYETQAGWLWVISEWKIAE